MPIISTVTVSVTLSNGVTLSNAFTRPPNEDSPGVVDWRLFPAGFTQLVNPPGNLKGLVIVPPADNIASIALVGDNNDNGVPISPRDVTFLSLAGPVDVGLKLGAATLIRLIWI